METKTTTTAAKAAGRKVPQDRRQKQGEAATPEVPDTHFSWTDPDGKVWASTMPVKDVITPGLVRRNRNNDMSFTMEVLEGLFEDQPEFFDTVDDSWDAMNAVSNALQETFTTMGTTMGESRGSSA